MSNIEQEEHKVIERLKLSFENVTKLEYGNVGYTSEELKERQTISNFLYEGIDIQVCVALMGRENAPRSHWSAHRIVFINNRQYKF